MKKLIIVNAFILILLAGCGQAIENEKQQAEDFLPLDKNVQIEAIISQMGHENLLGQYDQAIMKTNLGDIKVGFYSDDSPITVNNFLNLAKQGFYNGTKFHRVIKGFMIQGGDPLTKFDNQAVYGTGGPEYRFNDEFNQHKLVRGSLAMANSGPNTNGSQFFIVTALATPWLDGRHTNFGYVVSGMEAADAIEGVEVNERDIPLENIIIESIELLKK